MDNTRDELLDLIRNATNIDMICFFAIIYVVAPDSPPYTPIATRGELKKAIKQLRSELPLSERLDWLTSLLLRLEQLEKKVAKHNGLVERTYHLEEEAAVFEEKLKVANHRIDDLEHGT